jgi:hypothetical protein
MRSDDKSYASLLENGLCERFLGMGDIGLLSDGML